MTVKPAVLGCPAPVPLGQSGNTPGQEWMKHVALAGPVMVLHGTATDVAQEWVCDPSLVNQIPSPRFCQQRLAGETFFPHQL